jgi:sterol desaturase/sphingolipid hydroxylase (fatty acid hydroxylase superfamily)
MRSRRARRSLIVFVLDQLVAVFTHPVNVSALLLFAALAALEQIRPARPLPRLDGWRPKGVFFLLLAIVVSSTAPMLWDVWLGEHRLVDARALGDAGGAVAGFVVYEGLVYAWHRAMHASGLLWRTFHQLHHSAERIDVFGAFYFHPLDMLGFAFVASLALVGLLGLTPGAATSAALALTFCNLFQHANVRTPRWLGYLIQRPESHGVHHQRGVHRFNYSDLPLWDLVFGTFRNPERCLEPAGFRDGASRRLLELLFGRDVARPAPVRGRPASQATEPIRQARV